MTPIAARLAEALRHLRAGFVVSTGDKSPFAKEALRPCDEALTAYDAQRTFVASQEPLSAEASEILTNHQEDFLDGDAQRAACSASDPACAYPECNCDKAQRAEVTDDRKILLSLMEQFDSGTWVCPRCRAEDTCHDMDMAHELRAYLAAPSPPQEDRT